MPTRDYKHHSTSEHALWRFCLGLAFALFLLFISTASVKAAWDMYQIFDAAAAEAAAAELELAALKAEHVTVATTLKEFSTNRGLEAAVRERFGVVRPGEGEIRIIRSEAAEVIEPAPVANPFSRLFDTLFAW